MGICDPNGVNRREKGKNRGVRRGKGSAAEGQYKEGAERSMGGRNLAERGDRQGWRMGMS